MPKASPEFEQALWDWLQEPEQIRSRDEFLREYFWVGVSGDDCGR